MNSEGTEEYAAVMEMVKTIKKSNDSLSQSIGVRLDEEIARRVRAEGEEMHEKMDKIARFIAGKEKNYENPGTARRMAALKQHFRIQRDRRNNLISSLKEPQQAEEKDLDAETTCDSIKEKDRNDRNQKIELDLIETKQGEKTKINNEKKDSECIFPPDELIDLNETLVDKS